MIHFDCVNKTVLFIANSSQTIHRKIPQNHLQTLRNDSSLKPYHKTYIISCRFFQCSHNRHTFMKYTQIFVCIIARGQIARDRAMGAIFRRKYGLENIFFGGGGCGEELGGCRPWNI